MKNTILLLTASFLLLLSAPMIGQNTAIYSFETVELVNPVDNNTGLYYSNANSSSAVEMLQGEANTVSISIVFEVVFLQENIPTAWEESIASPVNFDDLFASENSPLTEFIDPLKFTYDRSSIDPFSLPVHHSLQNFIVAACHSILCSEDTFEWVELNDEGWDSKHKIQYPNPVSAQGNWHFRVGPNQDSYYFIPKQL